MFWILVLAGIVLAGTGLRTLLHDHNTDRALVPWATVQISGGALCVLGAWAAMSTT